MKRKKRKIAMLGALLAVATLVGTGSTWNKSVAPAAASWVDAPTASQFGW